MATSAPILTAAEMARIAPYLPRKRDDPVVISAIVYRNWSGLSLRHIANWYGVTVGRLQTWETQLRDGGQLAAIMKVFGLPHASALQWSNGGQVSAWRNPDMAKRIAALRFQQFRAALRAS